MNAKVIGQRIQASFDWIRDCLEPVDNRWIVFTVTVMILVLLRALGAHGLSTLLALVYVMYFVTIRQPDRDR